MQRYIQNEIQKTQTMMQHILMDQNLLDKVEKIASICADALRAGHKILFAGNGGSAADSQHLAAELVSRLSYDRPALAAMALTTDTSALTAIGNDYAFEKLFSRQIEALGQKGDIFIGISTSGKSPNILRALESARQREIVAIGFTGRTAPLMTERCDLLLNVPSTETPKIQEGHILLGHIICALIEEAIYGADYAPLRKTAAVAV
jgi:D-sedoheptulose 7-phosphate isomerase